MKDLLQSGYKVRGTVRSEAKGEYLKDLFKGQPFEYALVDDITKVSDKPFREMFHECDEADSRMGSLTNRSKVSMLWLILPRHSISTLRTLKNSSTPHIKERPGSSKVSKGTSKTSPLSPHPSNIRLGC